MRWLRISRPALWSLLNNSGLDGRDLSVCWNPDCRHLHILQAFSHFTYVTAHSDSPIFPSLHLRHSSFWFSNLSVTSPTSQLILQPFRCFTYVTAHSPTLPLLYLRHNSFSNPSVVSPTSQLILQPFFCFSYIQDFHLCHLASRPCDLICNVEVIPHISIKVHRWLKGCISAVLGYQKESEQIVTPVRSQISTLYSTQTVLFRTGVPPWSMFSLPSCTIY